MTGLGPQSRCHLSRCDGGPTTFDADGDRIFGTYDLWAIKKQNGQFVWETVSR